MHLFNSRNSKTNLYSKTPPAQTRNKLATSRKQFELCLVKLPGGELVCREADVTSGQEEWKEQVKINYTEKLQIKRKYFA